MPEGYPPLRLPEPRMSAHTAGEVPWAHVSGVSPMLPHSHVIPDDKPVEMKNALGDHIDRYHAPLPGPRPGV